MYAFLLFWIATNHQVVYVNTSAFINWLTLEIVLFCCWRWLWQLSHSLLQYSKLWIRSDSVQHASGLLQRKLPTGMKSAQQGYYRSFYWRVDGIAATCTCQLPIDLLGQQSQHIFSNAEHFLVQNSRVYRFWSGIVTWNIGFVVGKAIYPMSSAGGVGGWHGCHGQAVGSGSDCHFFRIIWDCSKLTWSWNILNPQTFNPLQTILPE